MPEVKPAKRSAANGSAGKRVRKNPEVRREELKRAATRLFVKKGYRATSVEDIVQAARVSKGTFYLYFASKPDILHALVQEVSQKIIARLLEILASDASAEEKLLHGLDEAFLEYGKHRKLMRIFEMAGPEAAQEGLRSQGWKESRPMLEALLEQGVREGSFHLDDFAGTADFIMLVVSDLQHLVLSPDSSVDVESGSRMLRAVLRGLLRGQSVS